MVTLSKELEQIVMMVEKLRHLRNSAAQKEQTLQNRIHQLESENAVISKLETEIQALRNIIKEKDNKLQKLTRHSFLALCSD